MRLYLDASALVKRYLDEPGSQEVETATERASAWLTSRVAFVETLRAVGLGATSQYPRRRFLAEWSVVHVVELDARLAERAGALAVAERLGSLDAIHLASALDVADRDLVVATWDRALWEAARRQGLAVLPESLQVP